jgi:hypothetical protein
LANGFSSELFILTNESDDQTETPWKKTFVPFGGGKHICPGRHFASAEILGAIAVLVLGFKIQELDTRPVEAPRGRTQKFGDGVVKADKERIKNKLRIKRRDGLEKTVWELTSGKE